MNRQSNTVAPKKRHILTLKTFSGFLFTLCDLFFIFEQNWTKCRKIKSENFEQDGCEEGVCEELTRTKEGYSGVHKVSYIHY